MTLAPWTNVFNLDPLAMILIALVGFIGINVASFAARYMVGDQHYRRFFVKLAVMIAAVGVMVAADHLLLLLAAWAVANALLVSLMVHKRCWPAARASGLLAARTLVIGFAAIAAAFALFYGATGQATISGIIAVNSTSPMVAAALVLLLVGAMTQSALWPFHRWLTSSLNSPSPVSAIMHAGLVNGGGFLLARFAPLYLEQPRLLGVIFTIGLGSALLGTLFKLLQNDVKRMLACSTMGQMGFMIAQCGLGLFPAAIAHLVWHGCFKAYLFLASGGAAQEKRLDLHYPPSLAAFAAALACGTIGSAAFALATGKPWLANDTSAILVILAGIAGTQFALPLVRERILRSIPLALIATAAIGAAYGFSVGLVETIMAPLSIMQPQPLNPLYIAGLALLIMAWLGMLFLRSSGDPRQIPEWVLRLYVRALNASQPHPATITSHRNHYAFR